MNTYQRDERSKNMTKHSRYLLDGHLNIVRGQQNLLKNIEN